MGYRELDRFGMDPGAWTVLGLMAFLGLSAIVMAFALPMCDPRPINAIGPYKDLSKEARSSKTEEAFAIQKPASLSTTVSKKRQLLAPRTREKGIESDRWEGPSLWDAARINPSTGMPL